MIKRSWKLNRIPGAPAWMSYFTMGDRNLPLPQDALVSVTYLENLNAWRGIMNGLVALVVMHQMKTQPGLLYSETRTTGKGVGYTLSVWEPKAMVQFRDRKGHGWAMNFFSWIFFGGPCQAYFLSWRSKGRIPTAAEIPPIIKSHAKWYDGGKLVRQASRPEWTGVVV